MLTIDLLRLLSSPSLLTNSFTASAPSILSIVCTSALTLTGLSSILLGDMSFGEWESYNFRLFKARDNFGIHGQ